ncbi:MAG: hypothetical protein A3K19_12670 [Lentisphaerae bacterium RIFOXYB12_FULL_65_16]|nr:MAG: hypothetical protein A3K18_24380 [Lentisphaerae bacterium RIFOXYA12_64_32]OGV88077.1 MAG: hypothetical protein A3K19_12670 [Lentisphaerae bacterium RIFOXYB12_FULL_65_16]
MDQRFTGKVAVVTGAGQGIGKGIALRLARDGADVVVADYNAQTAAAAAAEIAALGRQAVALQVDISRAESVQSLVDGVVARLGRIDMLVNNAGVVQTKPLLELTEADWDRVINTNQRGTFFMVQAVARQMLRQLPEALRAGGAPADLLAVGKARPTAGATADDGLLGSYGKIVNLSSVAGRRGRSLQAHYAASKAAIISLTQSAALNLAPYRINVNAVCPGIVPTPMWEQIDKDRAQLMGAKPGEAMAAFIATVPLKRAATAEDIAGAVAFFCSADADCITGQSLNVDGGFEMD